MNADRQRVCSSAFICVHLRLKMVLEHFSGDPQGPERAGFGRTALAKSMYSSVFIDGLFVAAVTLIWFMLGYQCLLFFLGHRYYRQCRLARGARRACPIPSCRR